MLKKTLTILLSLILLLSLLPVAALAEAETPETDVPVLLDVCDEDEIADQVRNDDQNGARNDDQNGVRNDDQNDTRDDGNNDGNNAVQGGEEAEAEPASPPRQLAGAAGFPIVGTYLPSKLPSAGVKGTAIAVTEMAAGQSITSGNSRVIAVSGNVLEFVGAGKATVKVTYWPAGARKATTVSKTIKVTAKVEGVSLAKEGVTLARKAKVTLAAIVSPADATNKGLTWTTSNKNVATVDSKGRVTAVGGGDCTITVKTKDGGFTATATISVTPIFETGMKLNKTAVSLNKGKTYSLKATLSPSGTDFKTVVWTSSDPAVATVDAKGKVTVGMQTGTVTITATSVNGLVSTCRVTVNPQKVTSIKMSSTKSTYVEGDAISIGLTIGPAGADNKAVVWSSSNNSVARVDQSGNVTFLAGGKVTIKATATDGSKKSASRSFTVEGRPVVRHVEQIWIVNIIESYDWDDGSSNYDVNLRNGKTFTIQTKVFPTNATNKKLKWSVIEGSNVASVSSSGEVKAKAKGMAIIRIDTTDGSGVYELVRIFVS
ncbi:MAG: Ig-like domain-containing protein [Clostridiales bacterium]|nr:Ig-like domain-containing protein [Clostridiales bacterium]